MTKPRSNTASFGVFITAREMLCDARILNIFEGATEIQAEVIARRLLDGRT